MLVIVDEFLDIAQLPDQGYSRKVKPVKIGKKYSRLQDTLKETKAGWRQKVLSPTPYQVSEELEYFSGAAGEERDMVYFYEPRYTSEETLHRVRNWLLPEKRLYPVPVYGNRAELLYLMDMLSKWLNSYDPPLTYQDVTGYAEKLRKRIRRWILSPLPMAVFQWKKQNTIYQLEKRTTFLLMEVKPGQKPVIHKPGNLRNIWDKLSEELQDQHIWAVCKGIDENLPGTYRQVHIEEPALPVNVPFVQVVATTATDTDLLEARK